MNLQRMLQLALAATVTLGALLLGIGQGSTLIPLLAAAGAGLSLWLTDFTGRFKLKPHVVTIAATGTLVIFGLDLYRMGPEQQLVAIANLLVYLQVVLMFQQKALRIYWQLLTLSLLQVVVAAALTLSAWFGPLLLAYLFFGLLSLSLIFTYRHALRFQPAAVAEGQSPALAPATGATAAGTSLAEGFQPASNEDLNHRRVRRDLVRQTSIGGAATLVLASMFFFIVPRFGKQALITNTLAAQSTIGFKEEVELGNLGNALQDPSSVMRVWFTDPVNGLPYEIAEEPLFRGAIVDTYDRKHGHDKRKWSQYQPVNDEALKKERAAKKKKPLQPMEPVELPEVVPGMKYVLQHIILEEQRENAVFGIYPWYRVDQRCPVERDPNRDQLIRKTRKGRLEFSLATTGLAAGRQNEVSPAGAPLEGKERQRMLALPEAAAGQRDPLRGLKETAANWAAELPSDRRSGSALASAMAENFPRKGFQYSLESPEREANLDPVEDFVTLHRSGHCEYFASALTLMLRSQGIPARMVIGFKGGEFNSLGNYYQVRMLHAHTWVEAYLEPDQLPEPLRRRRAAGGWLRLDPTPGSDEPPESRSLTLAEHAREWMDYGDYLWMNYVVGLDRRRQEDGIYGPLAITGSMMRALFTSKMWLHTVPNLIRSLFEGRTWRNLFAGLSLGRVLAALGAMSIAGALAWWFRLAIGRWLGHVWAWRPKRRRTSAGKAARERMVVAFYDQLESLLARHGIRRPESQTQHEFAMSVGGQLSETPRLAPAAWLPRKVVDAFYRVRFGGQALDKTEIEAVERSLRDLAAALSA